MIVIAISIDQGIEKRVRKLVKSYVNGKNLTFLNLLDTEAVVAAAYGVRGVPMNFFISPQGKIVAFASGYRKWKSKEGLLMVEQILSEHRQN